MVSQDEVDFMNMKIDALVKDASALNKKYQERGKALNKLWEKGKELRKEVAALKNFCGRITLNLAKLELENRIIVKPQTEQIGCEPKRFLVRDIVRQLINESGYDLEFNVLQKKASLTITGKILK